MARTRNLEREALAARNWRAANREKSRAYMRVYMRGWRAANLEVSRANTRDSMRRAKEHASKTR